MDRIKNSILSVDLSKKKKNPKIRKEIWRFAKKKYPDDIFLRKKYATTLLKSYYVYKSMACNHKKKYLYFKYKPDFQRIVWEMFFLYQ